MKTKINISAKAYKDFADRIRSTFDLLSLPADYVGVAIDALDCYIAGTRCNFDDLGAEVRLALLMLQAEVDRCLARSAAARARAEARKNATRVRPVALSEATHQTDTQQPEPIHVSRAERRAMDRAWRPRMKIKRLG